MQTFVKYTVSAGDCLLCSDNSPRGHPSLALATTPRGHVAGWKERRACAHFRGPGLVFVSCVMQARRSLSES